MANTTGSDLFGTAVGAGSSAAAGAMLGTAVAPGVGTALGAGIGGAIGLGAGISDILERNNMADASAKQQRAFSRDINNTGADLQALVDDTAAAGAELVKRERSQARVKAQQAGLPPAAIQQIENDTLATAQRVASENVSAMMMSAAQIDQARKQRVAQEYAIAQSLIPQQGPGAMDMVGQLSGAGITAAYLMNGSGVAMRPDKKPVFADTTEQQLTYDQDAATKRNTPKKGAGKTGAPSAPAAATDGYTHPVTGPAGAVPPPVVAPQAAPGAAPAVAPGVEPPAAPGAAVAPPAPATAPLPAPGEPPAAPGGEAPPADKKVDVLNNEEGTRRYDDGGKDDPFKTHPYMLSPEIQRESQGMTNEELDAFLGQLEQWREIP